MNSDSAVPGLNKNLAHGIQLTIPPTQRIKDFNQKTKPIFEKLSHNQSHPDPKNPPRYPFTQTNERRSTGTSERRAIIMTQEYVMEEQNS